MKRLAEVLDHRLKGRRGIGRGLCEEQGDIATAVFVICDVGAIADGNVLSMSLVVDMVTANVFEAARLGGVKRLIFFSSMHVNGLYERDQPYAAIAQGHYDGLRPEQVPLVTHTMPVRPDGPYAASKIFGEALGRYYAEAFGMTVICLRLGTVGRDDRPGADPRSYVSWVSHRDLAHLVEQCLTVAGLAYDIFFVASGNTWKIYDTPRAWQVLGIQPQDNAENYR